MDYRDKLVLAPMVRVVTPLDPSPSHESVGWNFLADSPSGAYDFGFELVLRSVWIPGFGHLLSYMNLSSFLSI